MSPHTGRRAFPPRRHPACPGRTYYRLAEHAAEAAIRLGGTPTPCDQCNGHHLTRAT